MSIRNENKFINYKTIPITEDVKYEYPEEYNPYHFSKRKVAKLILKILIKMKICMPINDWAMNVVRFERIEINLENLDIFINRKISEYWIVNGNPPKYVIIGKDNYKDIVNSDAITRQFEFDIEFESGYKVAGITIILKPEIDGFAII